MLESYNPPKRFVGFVHQVYSPIFMEVYSWENHLQMRVSMIIDYISIDR